MIHTITPIFIIKFILLPIILNVKIKKTFPLPTSHVIIKKTYPRKEQSLMQILFKIIKNGCLLHNKVINNTSSLTRTKKIFAAIDQICYDFDLSKPIWLDSNITEFKRHNKIRFYKDNFIDEINFDHLEMEVID